MKQLTATEKERFQKAGIIDDVTKEYWVDMKHRLIAEESILLKHFNEENSVNLAPVLFDHSPFANVSKIDGIEGVKKF